MAKVSAGFLLYRRRPELEVFLVHPGGPYWSRKDAYPWSIPKGLVDTDEDPLLAARREFREETGFAAEGEYRKLEPIRLPGGKLLHAWAVESDCDPALLNSNNFEIEWPPRSGRVSPRTMASNKDQNSIDMPLSLSVQPRAIGSLRDAQSARDERCQRRRDHQCQ